MQLSSRADAIYGARDTAQAQAITPSVLQVTMSARLCGVSLAICAAVCGCELSGKSVTREFKVAQPRLSTLKRIEFNE